MQTHTHSVTLNVFSLLYFTFCSSQHTSLNLTVCHVPCTSTKCTNCSSVLGETLKLPAATATHNTHIFPLPQHNLQNISTVSEGGSALHGPHILHSKNFCTSPGDRNLCAYNKNWTTEQIKNLNNIQQLEIFTHTNNAILSHIPHFKKTMAHCPQVTII